MARYLVTGGAGFIGCHLVEKLIAGKNEVLVYDNLSFGRLDNIKDFLDMRHFVQGDLNDCDLLEKTVKGFMPDIVYHLAAIHFIPYCNAHPREAVKVNVDGTHSLLEACAKVKPRKVLFASTAAVYPPSDSPHKETDELKAFDIYGATKICGEFLMQLYGHQMSTPVVNCRFFNAYGPKETNDHVLPHIIKQIKIGKTAIQLGNTSPKRDYIYTDDMANALIKLAVSDTGGYDAFNVGTGRECSVTDLVSKIGAILAKKLVIESIDNLKRKVEREHLCPDVSKIKEKIGWAAKHDIDSGLAALLEYEFKAATT